MSNNVINILVQNQATRPTQTALLFHNVSTTYSQLYLEALRIAKNLQQLNIRPKQPVGLLLKNNPQYLISYYGCLLAGVVPVLLPTYLSTNKLTYNFNKIKIESVIFDPELQKIVDEVEMKKGTPLEKLAFNNFKTFNSLEIGDPVKPGNSFPGIDNDNEPAVITFSSGNSGFPRISVHSQANLMANARHCAGLLENMRSIRLLCTLPVFNFIAHSFIPHAVALAGGTIVLTDKFNPEEISRIMAENNVNVLIGTPAFYDQFVTTESPGRFPELKYCLVCGGNLTENTWNILTNKYKVFVTELYGTTETQMLCVSHDSADRQKIVIGKPFNGIEIRIVSTAGAETAPGTAGELQIRTDSLMLNYFDEINHQYLEKSTWFGTGDLVKRCPDNNLVFVEKISNMIHRYGYLVCPKQIENVIAKHPAVSEVIVVPGENNGRDDQIKVNIIVREGASVTREEIIEYCRNNLPGYLQPEIIEFFSYFERDITGNVLRNHLNKS